MFAVSLVDLVGGRAPGNGAAAAALSLSQATTAPEDDELEVLLDEQVEMVGQQLSELADLKLKHLQEGGRDFYCKLVENKPDPPVQQQMSFRPEQLAETLHALLDHNGKVKPKLMDQFVDLCQNTSAWHQRAVLTSVIENLSKQQFRQFCVDSAGLARGIAILKEWAQPPQIEQGTSREMNNRKKDWCIQISSHVLGVLSRRVTGETERDKVFWRSLAPKADPNSRENPQKKNPLVELWTELHAAFKKPNIGVGGLGKGKAGSMYDYKHFEFKERMTKLKMCVVVLLSDGTTSSAASAAPPPKSKPKPEAVVANPSAPAQPASRKTTLEAKAAAANEAVKKSRDSAPTLAAVPAEKRGKDKARSTLSAIPADDGEAVLKAAAPNPPELRAAAVCSAATTPKQLKSPKRKLLEMPDALRVVGVAPAKMGRTSSSSAEAAEGEEPSGSGGASGDDGIKSRGAAVKREVKPVPNMNHSGPRKSRLTWADNWDTPTWVRPCGVSSGVSAFAR
jgi:hypothetical protein